MRTTKKTSLHFWTLWLIPLGFMILALAASPSRAGAQDISEGEQLFTAKGCNACHSIGGGDLVGPDLAGVTTRRDKAWLTRWLKEPDKVLAEGDATATELFEKYNKIPMPNLGLTDSEVASLVAYFEGLDSGGTTAPTAAVAALPPGDAENGKALFMGTKPLANGGPHCIACHSVSGVGALEGGNLGPDLTAVFNRYGGQAGLSAFLAQPSTVTMGAVWANQSLNEQEVADLVAFFETTTAPVRPASTLWTLAGLSGGGAAVFIATAQVWWRKRLKGVRKPMIERANAKK